MMRINHKEIFICLFGVVSGGFLYFIFQNVGLDETTNSFWFYKLLWNLLGYSVIFIPGYLIVNYVKKTNYIEELHKGCLWPVLSQCVYGREDESILNTNDRNDLPSSSLPFTKSAILLTYCFVGLQISYLTWGLLQEKIMTQPYSGVKFSDSQFLVFVNRIFGLVIATAYIGMNEGHRRGSQPPLYKYSYCAFSNVMSSWFQYEALKFVSFPTQVLAKASKIIPVMLMGKLISKRTYEFYEYLTAGLISFGMFLFLTGNADSLQVEHGSEEVNISSTFAAGFSGLIILVFYMVFDSFTSNWQSELFRTYRISSCRMMAGVNLFSCLLTGVSLIQQGTMGGSTTFLLNNPDFAMDCLILSICSAVGQLFIYYTIEKFGAVVFIIIMTIRQAIAVILSCIFYHHPITAIGIIGVFIVFVSIFLRIYCSYRLKQVRKKGSIQILSSSNAPVIKI